MFQRFASICLTGVVAATLGSAQDQGSLTTISTVPDGMLFYVDGQTFSHSVSSVWPAGSKHILQVPPTVQSNLQPQTQYQFKDWEFAGSSSVGTTLTITADSAITDYRAVFDTQYALTIGFYFCGNDTVVCLSPGKIVVGSTPVNSDTQMYLSAGSSIALQAIPNPGYVFTGWLPGPNQNIQGFLNTVTLNAPVSVFPQFKPARPIDITTQPDGLQVLADRSPVTSPVRLDWGYDTTHSVGPVSPQMDERQVVGLLCLERRRRGDTRL
jgi:hypothetical protein